MTTPSNTTVSKNDDREHQDNVSCDWLDHTQVSKLIIKEYSGLISLVRRRLKDRELAADLVNEAIAITLEHANLGRINGSDCVGGYVFKVSMNLLRNEARNFDNRLEMRCAPEAIELLATFDSDEIEANQIRDRTLNLLKALPSDRDREVIKRFYLDEEEKHAICESLSLTSLQFTQVISRARQRMRLIFEAEGHRRSDLLSLIPFLIIYVSACNI